MELFDADIDFCSRVTFASIDSEGGALADYRRGFDDSVETFASEPCVLEEVVVRQLLDDNAKKLGGVEDVRDCGCGVFFGDGAFD